MSKLKLIIQKNFFAPTTAYDAKMHNFIGVLGFLITTGSTIAFYASGTNILFVIGLAVVALVILILLFFANRFNIYNIATIVDMILLTNVFFPFAFFFRGGIESPSIAYFVLSIALYFVLIRGKAFAILLAIHCFIIGSCLFLQINFPEILSFFPTQKTNFGDLISIFVSGFTLGIIIMYQYKLFRDEQKKVELANEQLSRHDILLRSINDAATIFLAAEKTSFATAFGEGISLISDSLNVENTILWKADYSEQEEKYIKIGEWNKNSNTAISEEIIPCTFTREDLPESWINALNKDNHVVIDSNTKISTTDKKRLEDAGMKSMLMMPVFMSDSIWGIISFYNTANEKVYSNDEINIAKSAGHIIMSAYHRELILNDLVDVREKALEGTRAKSDFLSNMSHEMRTPMNAIIGMTSIAKSSQDPERKEECLSKIADASTHLLGLINDILDMSKIEAGKLELSPIDFNFEDMFRRAINIINHSIVEKKQRFYFSLDNNIPDCMHGDDQRILQVITNLLSNASKFTQEEGELKMTATLKKEDADFCTIHVNVNDNGIGMTEEQQGKLFQSFQQADSSTSRKFGGTGLGLAISKQIVEMMNGTLDVFSAANEGATFSFDIDIKKTGKTYKRTLPSDVDLKNLSALFVDYDKNVRENMAHILDQTGVKYDMAATGEDAICLLESNQNYDLIFVDLELPDMDGIEISRKIKSIMKNPPAIIMISSTHLNNAEEKAKDANADILLSKPLFSSDIINCINFRLGKKTEDDNHDNYLEGVFEGYHVLIADDIEINREVITGLLEDTGLAFDYAENGNIVVSTFNNNPNKYDLIFMDIQMPELDGIGATKQIRALGTDYAVNIPIIAMTANVFSEDVNKCLEAGMNDHLGKPLNIDAVLEILNTYLKDNKHN